MNITLVVFLFVLNFAISWFNAWSVGRSWLESKAAGGFVHFVTWCGAVMSASGFTWCYSILLALGAANLPYKGHMLLPPRYAMAVLELGYLVVILPVIGSGIGILIASWQNFMRSRSLLNGGVAGYNTLANVYNIYNASRAVPMVLRDLGGLFDKGDKGKNWLVILLVALAVLGGAMTTFAIVQASARAKAYKVSYELNLGSARAY